MNHPIELVPVLRKDRVTLYGRVVNNYGKLGLYEVHHDLRDTTDLIVYAEFKDAEKRFIALTNVKHSTNLLPAGTVVAKAPFGRNGN